MKKRPIKNTSIVTIILVSHTFFTLKRSQEQCTLSSLVLAQRIRSPTRSLFLIKTFLPALQKQKQNCAPFLFKGSSAKTFSNLESILTRQAYVYVFYLQNRIGIKPGWLSILLKIFLYISFLLSALIRATHSRIFLVVLVLLLHFLLLLFDSTFRPKDLRLLLYLKLALELRYKLAYSLVGLDHDFLAQFVVDGFDGSLILGRAFNKVLDTMAVNFDLLALGKRLFDKLDAPKVVYRELDNANDLVRSRLQSPLDLNSKFAYDFRSYILVDERVQFFQVPFEKLESKNLLALKWPCDFGVKLHDVNLHRL